VGDDRWDEQVGSVAEEAQRLLETLRRAGGPPSHPAEDADHADHTEGAAGAGAGAGSAHERSDAAGTGSEPDDDEAWTCTDPFCRACPLCRTVAVVRGLNPETLRRLADLASVAATVLTDLAAQRASAPQRPAAPPHTAPDGSAGGPTAAEPARTSGRPIPVRDAGDEEGTGD
jgi:hypothetical protein